MFPVYLGYAKYTFTTVGPSGGVLYPWLLLGVTGGTVTDFDLGILMRLPKVLEPLSQGFGSPIAYSGLGMPGPTSVVGAGLVVAFFVLGAAWWSRRRRLAKENLNPV
jgi:hypothetical protein